MVAELLSLDAAEITTEANLAEDLGFDSLDSCELKLMLEDELEVQIQDEALSTCKTVGDIVALAQKRGQP